MFEKNVLAENDFKVLIKVVQINYASFWHLRNWFALDFKEFEI